MPQQHPTAAPLTLHAWAQVEVHNFSVVITLDKALPTGSSEPAGHAPGPAEGIGSRLQLRIRSLSMHNACAGAYGVLATDVGVKGVSLDIEQPPQLPASFPGTRSGVAYMVWGSCVRPKGLCWMAWWHETACMWFAG